jgi:RNA polymerase sigma-70 factor (ECF subfamily)
VFALTVSTGFAAAAGSPRGAALARGLRPLAARRDIAPPAVDRAGPAALPATNVHGVREPTSAGGGPSPSTELPELAELAELNGEHDPTSAGLGTPPGGRTGMTRPVTDPDLARRFRDGDPDSVRELYELYGRAAFGVAFRALGSRSLAEEAVQQAFLQAWRASGSVDPARDLGPWLFTIIRRAAIDIYRKEARRPHDAIDDTVDNDPTLAVWPAAIEAMSETWDIRVAVDGLPNDEREVVRLQHFDGLTHHEIAEQIGVPLGTVKSRSFRAHKRLAAALGHLHGGSG